MIEKWVVCSIATLVLSFGVVFAVADEMMALKHDGDSRTYLLHVPPSLSQETAAPLVLALHGRSGNGERMAALTGFNSRSDEHGFIVAYPEAVGGAWNYLHGISGYDPQPDDSGFLVKLVNTLAARYNIDPDRVYVAGISNGGFMAQRLACRATGHFAAFASVAAGGYGAMPLRCRTPPPINVLYVHGTEDTLVPWQGLTVEDPDGNRERVTMSITDSLKFWSRRNHCGPEVSSRALPRRGGSSRTVVQFLTADSCEADAEVSLYAVVGGGHNWPGSRGIIPSPVAGVVNMDIHASDVIWSFFQRHRSSGRP